MTSYLFISNVLSRVSGRFLHGRQAHDLKQVVLHHVSDDPKLVKVASSAVGTKGLFEGDHHTRNVIAVPDRLEDGVGKPDKGRRGECVE